MPEQPAPSPMAEIKESELLSLIDKTRALDATYKLLDYALGSLEFDDLCVSISNIIPNAMGYELGMVFLLDHLSAKLTKVGISNDLDGPAVNKILSSEVSIPLGYEDNLMVRCATEKIQYVSGSIYEFLKPAVNINEGNLIQEKLKIKSHIATPLIARGKSIGVLLVGMAKEVSNISDFEKLMLKKFAENAGVAVQNAKLYSNLRTAKEDLHKAYENLKVLNKLKDEFLSVASHELRTPMTIVKSYLWMLEKQKAGRLNAKQTEYLKKATEGTQRMIALINDMLDISRFEQKKVTFDMKQINLCNIISEVTANFEIQAKNKGLYLKLIGNGKEIFVDADESKFTDILNNLLSNAIKFTDEGGVTIGVGEVEDEVKVWIKDTGSGVEPENLDKLFHKFGRIDNSYTIATEVGGTGLGLYIVKIYVEGMNGRVGAWSEGQGKGSTFWFTLPKNEIKKFQGYELKQVDVPVQDISSPQE